MPEPVILVLSGIALYKLLTKPAAPSSDPAGLVDTPAAATAGATPIGTGQAGTTPESPLATPTSVANQGTAPLATALTDAIPVPGDLVVALDNDTALKMRAYAALNPEDFQVFLNRYADRIRLRNDLYLEAIDAPPPGGYELTPGMMIGLGTSAYKVVQALNGVAAGRYGDIFGSAASVAGQIPGVNQDFVSSLQGLTLGYRAFTSVMTFADIVGIAAANGVSVMNVTATMLEAGGVAGAMASMPIASLSGVLMAVGLVVDIGFTIAGDAPDIQKAIDVALDVASLVCLFIPVVGWVIAIVIQLVKFIIDMFGSELFGGGMSHEQREVLETARYGENLNPMFPTLSNAYTPRELWKGIVEWGSGYCGGVHIVAMSVALKFRAGDTFMAGGVQVTVPPDLDGSTFGFGNNEQAGGCYWIKSWANTSLPQLANITNDEQAWLLGAYGPINEIVAMAQAGIADWRKEQFNNPTEQLIAARSTPMRKFLVEHGLTLDQCDMIAMEYRAQPHLTALAETFGWETWQELFASVVADEWRVFNWTVSQGSLSDFARQNGYGTMYAFRAGALAGHEKYYALKRQFFAWLGTPLVMV